MMQSTYAKIVPTLISNNVDNFDEVARWVLDRNRVPYVDERHGPGLYVIFVNRATGLNGTFNQPALVMTDAIVNRSPNIVDFLEERCAPCDQLYPHDPEEKAKVKKLFADFQSNLMVHVTKYAYSVLLPERKLTLPVFKEGIPWWEKLVFDVFYGPISKVLSKGLGLKEDSTKTSLARVRKEFAQVDKLLSDGRNYLTGDTFTAADVVFASTAAPMVLPDEFGGASFNIKGVPTSMRTVIEEMRATAAGKHILKMYREERVPVIPASELPAEPGRLSRLKRRLAITRLARSIHHEKLSRSARRNPLKFTPNGILVNGCAEAVGVLERPENFTQAVLQPRWEALSLSSPSSEQSLLKKSVKPGDAEIVRELVRGYSNELTALAKSFGQLDVVSSYVRIAVLRLVEDYVGVSSPNWTTMRHWADSLFEEVYGCLDPKQPFGSEGQESASKFQDHVRSVIAQRKAGGLDADHDHDKEILGRMIAQHGVQDEEMKKAIGGVIVSLVEPLIRSVAYALDELFRRPCDLAGAVSAASSDDSATVQAYVREAWRFRPPQNTLLRGTEESTTLKAAAVHEIPGGSLLFVALASAMLDTSSFPEPNKFDTKREASYLSLPQSIDADLGCPILQTAATELVAGVLRLPGLRRSPSAAGKIIYNRNSPNNFVVAFSPASS